MNQTFSQRTKRELSQLRIQSKIEALLELSAMARFHARILMNHQGMHLRFSSENADVIVRIQDLAVFLYQKNLTIFTQTDEHLQKEPMYFLDLPEESMKKLLEQSGIDLFGRTTQTKERILSRLKALPNARAYFRGAFMAAGSVVDPSKSYHLEVTTEARLDAEVLDHVFETIHLPFKKTRRKTSWVFYLKDSSAISDCLVDLGASQAMLELENAKAMKDLRNEINRKVNAETANLDKQVDAAMRQRLAIVRIRNYMGLENLPERLQGLAQARLAYPSANLRELGELLKPPLGKSGVSHRMRKLEEIARELPEDTQEGREESPKAEGRDCHEKQK